jgi:leucyl aminopeptidase
MRHALNAEPWKSLLSESSVWLDSVKVDAEAAVPQGALVAVVVRGDADNKDVFTLDAKALEGAQRGKVEAAAKAIAWRPAAGGVLVDGGGQVFALIPVSSIKATPLQLARQVGLDLAKVVKEQKIAHLAIVAPAALSVGEIFDGYAAGVYAPAGFKGARKKDPSRLPARVTLVGDAKLTPASLAERVELAKAHTLARFLQDAPANYLTPAKFAEVAKDVARDNGVTCKVLDKDQMTQLGMGSLMSVADGSANDPRLIVLEIDGKDNSKAVALVGKGLTFDSGGISIKPSAGMEEMKYDMSGGAAVLAAARFFAKVKPPVKVVCLIGAVENMPSGTATKPGDIVRAMNGKTIEVHNTDAEGRLVLADVLHYAISSYKPGMVIDIATLTGAVLMALGCVGAAVMTNDATTGRAVLDAAEGVGEPMWQLPLWPELEKEVKSEIADLKNIAKANVKAGTIIGAMFLKEFVGDTKWVHLDVAGTAWNCQAVGYPASGGGAFGMRTMIAACMRYHA